jgi:hypothetical protein
MISTKPKVETEKCKKEDCTKRKVQENEYCALHQKFYQRCVFLDETAKVGKKTCYNVIRGCRSQMASDYRFSKCGVCLEKERAKDHAKRGKALESVKGLESAELQEKTCTICCFVFPMTDFVGQKEGVITKSCIRCRNDNKKQDLKRDKVHREALARIADQKPDRKYKQYIKSAKERNMVCELTKEQLVEITSNVCYYCGEKENNGIDRLDAAIGYTISNSVSCCKMCNYLKGSLDVVTFLRRVEHILSYQKKIDNMDIRHYDCFANAINVGFYIYKYGAKKRGKSFELEPEMFDFIISKECYLCGKVNSENHQNGIDRIDNNIGYFFDNCLACCGECNKMKRILELENMLDKMVSIYHLHANFQEEDYAHISRNIYFILKRSNNSGPDVLI